MQICKITIVIFCIPSIFGCTMNEREFSHFDRELEYNLVSETNRFLFKEVYNPSFGGFRLIDSKIYVSEAAGEDVAFHILNINEENGSLAYEKGLGRRGRGPGEFNLIDDFVDGGSSIHLYDGSQLKLVRYDKDTMQLSTDDDIHIRTLGRMLNVYPAGDDRMIGMGLFFGNRFNIIDKNGETIAQHGEQIIFNEDFSERDTALGWLSLGAVHPEGTDVYLFSTNADFIEQYDINGQLMKRIQGTANPLPEMELVDSNGTLWPYNTNGVHAYVSVTSNDQYIYGLYSGRTGSGNLLEGMLTGNIIHKFDWDLNLIEAYQLDQEVTRIAVDGNRRIYTYLEADDGIEFLMYELF